MNVERVWRLREEIYPKLFGPAGRGIFPLPLKLFDERFGQQDVDPQWLVLGVFEFPPIPARNSWLYVTSGYSDPWGEEPKACDPEGATGCGVEFTFTVSEQGDWAIQTLQSVLAFDLLLGAGRFGDKPQLSFYDKISLGGPLNGHPDCEIRHVIMVQPEQMPDEFSLPTGTVQFMGFTGVTDAELSFANTHGSEPVISRLRAAGHHPITDPHRSSLILT
jgi:hypothetical protein